MPGHKDMMVPFLTYLSDGKARRVRDVKSAIASIMALDAELLSSRMKDGRNWFANRVEYANARMKIAGLVQSEAYGYVKITPFGLQELNNEPDKIPRLTEKKYYRFRT